MSTALLTQGTTLTWAGTPLENVTRVTFGGGADGDQNAQEVSVAHLGSCECKEEPFIKTWATPISQREGNTIQIDRMGTASPFTTDQVAALSISGKVSWTFSVCTCVSIQTTAQVGDVVRESVTLRFQ